MFLYHQDCRFPPDPSEHGKLLRSPICIARRRVPAIFTPRVLRSISPGVLGSRGRGRTAVISSDANNLHPKETLTSPITTRPPAILTPPRWSSPSNPAEKFRLSRHPRIVREEFTSSRIVITFWTPRLGISVHDRAIYNVEAYHRLAKPIHPLRCGRVSG